MHEVPHLAYVNHQLHKTDNTFGVSAGDYYNVYTKSLLPIPVIIACIGTIAIIFLSLSLCFRTCCTSLRCMPMFNKDGTLPFSAFATTALPVIIGVFCVFAIVANQAVLFGNRDLNDAVHIIKNAFSFLANAFNNLYVDGIILENNADALQTNTTAAVDSGCVAAATLTPDIQSFQDNVDSYMNYVSPLPGEVAHARHKITTIGVHDKNASLWVLYVAAWVVTLLYIFGQSCRSKVALQSGISITTVLMEVLICFCAAEMVLLIGLGDFCMAPQHNFLQAMSNASNYPTIEYYVTCEGDAPFEDDIQSARNYLNLVSTNIDLLQTTCPGNEYVDNLAEIIPRVYGALDDISNNTDCGPYMVQAQTVLEHGVCHSGFQGFFTVWVSQYLLTFCLFVVTVAASLSYQYFDYIMVAQKDTEMIAASAPYPNPSPAIVYGKAPAAEDPSTVEAKEQYEEFSV